MKRRAAFFCILLFLSGIRLPGRESATWVEVTKWLSAGGQPGGEDFRAFQGKGYQAMISLRTAEEDVDLPAEQKLVSSLGMKHVNIPMPGRNPQEAHALAFLKAMDELKGQKVLVYCRTGVRAGSVVLVFLVLKEGMEQEKAEEIAARVGLNLDRLRDFARQVIERHRRLPA